MAMTEDDTRERAGRIFRMGTISTTSDPERLREIRAALARLRSEDEDP